MGLVQWIQVCHCSYTGFPMSNWCFSSDSFDKFGKDLVHVRGSNLEHLNHFSASDV